MSSDPQMPEHAADKGTTSPLDAKELLHCHVAEYAALTMRNTYWLTLQFAVWSIVLIYVTAAVFLWGKVDQAFLLWGSAAIVQVAVLHWFHCGQEMYINVRYLESTLRPKVRELVGAQDVWGYEEFLARHRGPAPKVFETWPVALCVLGLALIGKAQYPWATIADCVGIVVNAVLLVGMVYGCVALVQTRHRFWQSA